ncbi:hypothetical protein QBC43DRAFT_351643 [Cladorrhinum sp. PSN259]|nr:hypothetical protein QBC43DRAFT_351643 [Cladorrhinum sp. PSN259]
MDTAKRSRMQRLTERLRDWKNGKSRSRTPAAASSATPQGQSTEPPPSNDEAVQGALKQPATLEDECSALWEEAYTEIKKQNGDLVANYETVLKHQAGIEQNSNLQDQVAQVANMQQQKAQNKQWKFQWFGAEQTVRDTVERILSITSRSAELVSLGMSHAPPYVSVPWSAITALIPLMMNDIKEHNDCIAGLEIVAKLTFSYQMAERTFLGNEETKHVYKKSVKDLYKKILEYQVLSIDYFGKSTLRRLGKNVLSSTEWADMPATLSELDRDTQRALQFLGQNVQIGSLSAIQEFLEQQKRDIDVLIKRGVADRDKVADVIRWVTLISVERDHLDVRKKLGEDHFSSGHWYLEEGKAKKWKMWMQGSQCMWLRGGVGTGKSSLTSILFEDLVRSPDGVIAVFYCSRKEDKNSDAPTARLTSRNDTENILRSILA